ITLEHKRTCAAVCEGLVHLITLELIRLRDGGLLTLPAIRQLITIGIGLEATVRQRIEGRSWRNCCHCGGNLSGWDWCFRCGDRCLGRWRRRYLCRRRFRCGDRRLSRWR